MTDIDYDEIRYDVARANARARLAANPIIMATLAQNLPQVKLPFNLFEVGTLWKEDSEGPYLWLVPKSHFDQVPDGAAMVSITGEVKIKGVDIIDQDTRGGFLAFGFFGTQLGPEETVCGLVEASCRCAEPAGHDGPHVCDCSGSWAFDETGSFIAVRFPTT